MANQYLAGTGSSTQKATAPYNAGYDGVGEGEYLFIAARVASSDVGGLGDEQCIASMWAGSTATTLSWRFQLLTDGTIEMYVQDGSANVEGAYTGVLSTDKSIIDGDDFWIAVQMRVASGVLYAQFYWGGTGGTPSWATYGSEVTFASATGIKANVSNNLCVGMTREASTNQDEWYGEIFEVLVWDQSYDTVIAGATDPIAWFNAEDFTVGDGNTDTAVSSSSVGETWTLTGSASMIADDTGVTAGPGDWWSAVVAAGFSPAIPSWRTRSYKRRRTQSWRG